MKDAAVKRMSRMLRYGCAGLLGLLVLSQSPTVAQSQDFPSRPITIVVPFAAGSGSDTAARILAQRFQTLLNASVVVENKVGATGMLASNLVARATPDGYTMLLATNSTHGTNPSLYKNITYDPSKDFAGIGKIAIFNYVLVGSKDLASKTIQELVAYAKANPDKLSYASGSTTSLIMAETFKRGTGTAIQKVPYRSNPQALTDVLAGRVSIMFADISSSIEFIKSGQMRAFAAIAPQRSAIFPELPTVVETVLPTFDLNSWTALVAPAGTPPPVIAKLNSALNQILAIPEVKSRLLELGAEAQGTTPAELDAFIKSEVARWGTLVKEAGLEPE